MGLLFAGVALGILMVFLALLCLWLNAQRLVIIRLARQLASDNAKLDLELKKAAGALQDAVTPVNISFKDEQVLKLASLVVTAIEQMRKAELQGMN